MSEAKEHEIGHFQRPRIKPLFKMSDVVHSIAFLPKGKFSDFVQQFPHYFWSYKVKVEHVLRRAPQNQTVQTVICECSTITSDYTEWSLYEEACILQRCHDLCQVNLKATRTALNAQWTLRIEHNGHSLNCNSLIPSKIMTTGRVNSMAALPETELHVNCLVRQTGRG